MAKVKNLFVRRKPKSKLRIRRLGHDRGPQGTLKRSEEYRLFSKSLGAYIKIETIYNFKTKVLRVLCNDELIHEARELVITDQ